MSLTGASLISGRSVPGTAGTLRATDPRTGEPIDPAYRLLGAEEVAAATGAAAEAFGSYRALAPAPRAAFLDAIAAQIAAIGDEIVERAGRETGLPEPRLRGEIARTTGQLRLFAEVVRDGDHHGVRIDPALPERTPLPRVDIRQRMVPLGPVAVFGASNFPLAFSVAGGDTASALAAGCPVVVKGHSAHPGTGELVGAAIVRAAAEQGIHPGVFSLLLGPGESIGQALAADPRIAAIGFTGSRRGGLALVATAAARPVPIPVFAEMSSINPVLVLPGALDGDLEDLAQGFLGSVTGSAGQLCTSPGLLLVPTGQAGDALVAAIGEAFRAARGQTMLTHGIGEARRRGIAELSARDGVRELAIGPDGEGVNAPGPVVLETAAAQLAGDEVLSQEIFGAVSLVVRYDDPADLPGLLAGLEGQLTVTLHLGAADHDLARTLLPELERLAGRILVGGWPTGVEVGHAMVHGGPFPATSDPRSTSVGTRAIERFLRPIAYQSFPDDLLPEPLREDNPWSLGRRIDGAYVPATEDRA